MLPLTGAGLIAVGDVLEGKYRVQEMLGSGAMGLVYGAVHQALNRRLAVKTLRAEIAGDAEVVRRFQQEARAAGSIGHPNIVQIFDAGCTQNGIHYIVMERLEGRSLEDELAQQPICTPDRAIQIGLQVLSGLSAAHRRGIVHRDLKPANIFLARGEGGTESVKLLDFGISKVLESADPWIGRSDIATRHGSLVGTRLYMSPEQARAQSVDHRTDLWSLGCVLYEMVCGLPPFDHDHPAHVISAILIGEFPPPRQLRPSLSDRLEQVILRAMAARLDSRYPDAEGMAAELSAAAEATGGTERILAALTNLDEKSLDWGHQIAEVLEPQPQPQREAAVAAAQEVPKAQSVADPFAPPDEGVEQRLELAVERIADARAFQRGAFASPAGPTARGRAGEARKTRRSGSIVASAIAIVLLALAGGAYYRYTRLGYWGLAPPAPDHATLHLTIAPPDAEVLVGDESVVERPLVTPIGVVELTFRAKGRLTVRRKIDTSAGTVRVDLRLPWAVSPIDASIAVSRKHSSTSDDIRLENFSDLDSALVKLELYSGCVRAMARQLSDCSEVFFKSNPISLSRQKLPAVIPLPTDALGACRAGIEAGRAREPRLIRVDTLAKAYLDALDLVVPATRDFRAYLDSKRYENDMFSEGNRLDTILRRELEPAREAQRNFAETVLSDRIELQRMELDLIRAHDKENAHWQLRSLVLASQALALATAARRVAEVDKRRSELEVAARRALAYAQKNADEIAAIPGGRAYLDSVASVLSAQGAGVLSMHNQTIILFNAIVLP
jgi:serine/threonine-protein kinase